jgi:hypothetical protein
MANRSTIKDDLYAQHLFAGMDQLVAYHKAGYKGGKPAACRKAKTPEIRNRVAELRAEFAKTQTIDRQWVMDELVSVYTLAKADNEYQAARATLKDIGLELGMFIERKDIHVHAMFEKLSNEELIKQIEQANRQVLTIEHGTQE